MRLGLLFASSSRLQAVNLAVPRLINRWFGITLVEQGLEIDVLIPELLVCEKTLFIEAHKCASILKSCGSGY